MQQIIKFTGKISREGQMNGLPTEIYGFITLQDANYEMMSQAIADQFGRYRNMGGMISETVQGTPMDLQASWLVRMYVPSNWIVKIEVSLHNLGKDISVAGKDGVERYADDSEPVKQ
jgi:hypothetical protein